MIFSSTRHHVPRKSYVSSLFITSVTRPISSVKNKHTTVIRREDDMFVFFAYCCTYVLNVNLGYKDS